jgi:hypothetical protein
VLLLHIVLLLQSLEDLGGERERVKGVGSTKTNTIYHLLEGLVFLGVLVQTNTHEWIFCVSFVLVCPKLTLTHGSIHAPCVVQVLDLFVSWHAAFALYYLVLRSPLSLPPNSDPETVCARAAFLFCCAIPRSMLIPLLSFWIPRPGTVAGRSHNFFCWPAQSGSFGNPWFGPGCHASPRSQKK